MTAGSPSISPAGRLRQVELRRYWRQLNAESRWGVVILAVILVLSVSVPLLSPNDPYGFVDQPLQPPSAAFLFGTDHLGRDLLGAGVCGGAA